MKLSIAIKPNVCSISNFKLNHSVVTQFKSREWTSDEVSITTLHLMTATKKLKFECPTFMRKLALILLLHLTLGKREGGRREREREAGQEIGLKREEHIS